MPCFSSGRNDDSGIRREGIGYGIEEMRRIKTIPFNLAPSGLGETRQNPRM
jgi:hypothetical protein